MLLEPLTDIEETVTFKDFLYNGRRIDIVIDSGEEKPTWLEVKSYNGKNLRAGNWNVHNSSQYVPHREFTLDCAGRKEELHNESFQWWVHDFNHKPSRHKGPTSQELKKFNSDLHDLPTPAKYVKYLVGRGVTQCKSVDAELFNIWNVMTSSPVRGIILDGITDATINDEENLGESL